MELFCIGRIVEPGCSGDFETGFAGDFDCNILIGLKILALVDDSITTGVKLSNNLRPVSNNMQSTEIAWMGDI